MKKLSAIEFFCYLLVHSTHCVDTILGAKSIASFYILGEILVLHIKNWKQNETWNI